MYVSIGVTSLYAFGSVDFIKINKSHNEAQVNMVKLEGLLLFNLLLFFSLCGALQSYIKIQDARVVEKVLICGALPFSLFIALSFCITWFAFNASVLYSAIEIICMLIAAPAFSYLVSTMTRNAVKRKRKLKRQQSQASQNSIVARKRGRLKASILSVLSSLVYLVTIYSYPWFVVPFHRSGGPLLQLFLVTIAHPVLMEASMMFQRQLMGKKKGRDPFRDHFALFATGKNDIFVLIAAHYSKHSPTDLFNL